MTHTEMLKKLGLSNADFSDLLTKFRAFYASLSPSEAHAVNVLMPKFQSIAKVLGGDITRDELKNFLTPPAAAPSPVAARSLTAAADDDGGGGGTSGQSGINQMTNDTP